MLPRNVDPADRLARASLGGVPIAYDVSGTELGANGELWERTGAAGNYPVALRWREELLPDGYDRYWQWLVWRPGTTQLRPQDAVQFGRAPNKQAARGGAFDYVDGIRVAQVTIGA